MNKRMLSGREWLCEFASKVTKHDYNSNLHFTQSSYIQKRLRVLYMLVVHFNTTIHTISGEKDDSFIRMACIERASPALMHILLKLYR